MSSRVLPWACEGVGLGEDVLELGPGYGVTTRWLASHGGRLIAVEIDPILAAGLRRGLGQPVEVHIGSGTDLPFADAAFDTVVCFTMLHHLPSPAQQDQLFAEAARVLRPGGVFAGSGSTLSVPFRLLHLGDTMTVVDPHTLPARLQAAGLADVQVDVRDHSQRFSGRRPDTVA